MSEILLVIVIVVLLAYHIYYAREYDKREQKYIKALLARNLPELVDAELATKLHKEEPPHEQDLVSAEEMTDTLFDKVIANQLKGDDQPEEE